MAGMRVYRYDGKTDEFMGETVEDAHVVRQTVKRAGASGGYYVGPEDARGQTLSSRTVTSLSVETGAWAQFVSMFPLKTARVQTTNRPACHYCGQPATGVDFFGAHCCAECGGH